MASVQRGQPVDPTGSNLICARNFFARDETSPPEKAPAKRVTRYFEASGSIASRGTVRVSLPASSKQLQILSPVFCGGTPLPEYPCRAQNSLHSTVSDFGPRFPTLHC